MHDYLEKRQIEAILRFGNHFYHVFSSTLKVVQECPTLLVNNLDNEVCNE